jgi:3-methyladenine DNA glycosylase AlkD
MSEARRSARSSAKSKRTAAGTAGEEAQDLNQQVQAVLASLERLGTRRYREGLARYGIHVTKAFGVPVGKMQALAKRLGQNHELALALWKTGWYEARVMATFLDDPERVTPAQMDRWSKDFDNWGICDTACFHLFDCTPHAYDKVEQWSRRPDEFGKRAGFALLACLALHDKQTGDDPFVRGLRLIEQAATDERNFVKKGVSWALRLIGRRNLELNKAAVAVAQRLAASSDATSRWLGKGPLRELTSAAVMRRLETKNRASQERSKKTGKR